MLVYFTTEQRLVLWASHSSTGQARNGNNAAPRTCCGHQISLADYYHGEMAGTHGVQHKREGREDEGFWGKRQGSWCNTEDSCEHGYLIIVHKERKNTRGTWYFPHRNNTISNAFYYSTTVCLTLFQTVYILK